MVCKRCDLEPVYKTLTNVNLCKNCFIKYFENKVFKTISKYKLIKREETILIALSGEKDSLTVLYLIDKLNKKKNMNLKLKGILVNEGIKDYRDKKERIMRDFIKKNDIYIKEIIIVKYMEFLGYGMDDIFNEISKKNINKTPCNICGINRRYIINKYSKILKADKVATGHNLDDEVQSMLINIFKNNYDVFFRLGPITDEIEKGFIRRIKPLYFVTNREVELYTKLKKFVIDYNKCPYSKDSFRRNISKMLDKLEEEHKGIKTSAIRFFLKLKNDFENNRDEEKKKNKKEIFSFCKKCGEPSQKEICNFCKINEELKEIFEL